MKYHILLHDLHFKEGTEKFVYNYFLKNEYKNYSRAEKIVTIKSLQSIVKIKI